MAEIDETELPAQATGATLPGQAAAAADTSPLPDDTNDIEPALTAERALLQANYGDTGAQQYEALRNAGRQAPPPAAPAAPPPTPTPSGPAGPAGPGLLTTLLGGNPQQFSPIFGLLAGRNAEMKIGQQNLERAVKAQEMRVRAQDMALKDADFMEKLRSTPPEDRALLIAGYMHDTGRPISVAQAAYISKLNPTEIEHTATMARSGDVNAIARLQGLFGTDWNKMLTAADDIRKSHADAEKAIDEALITRAKVPFATRQAEAEARGKEATAVHTELQNKFFEDTPERQAQAEADAKLAAGDQTMAHGNPARTDFINSRVAALKSVTAYQIKLQQTIADFDAHRQSGILKNANNQREALANALNYDFAKAVYDLAHDPDIQKDNAAWQQRVVDFLEYMYGGTTPAKYDGYAALSALSGLAAVGPYLHGVRSSKFVKPIIDAHGPSVVRDPPARIANKAQLQMSLFRDNLATIYQSEDVPEQNRLLLTNRPAVPLPGMGPKAGPTPTEPVRVTSRAEVEALPPGTPFINPADGSILYKKP